MAGEGTSLFSILDDKNRQITALRDQLENQKLQLLYYFKRTMDDSKLASISRSCTPDASDGSVSVALAVDRFKRSLGIKSDARRAYERMRSVDGHVDEALRGHEFLLREVFGALQAQLDPGSPLEVKARTLEVLLDPERLDLMNRLVESTISLRNRLEAYRICCGKLAAIEEERNVVVEEVFALPPDERMNVNHLVNVQAEKNRLERQLERMLQERDEPEEKLPELRHQLERSGDDKAARFIDRLLGRIDCDARSLLDATERIKLKRNLKREPAVSLAENVKRAIRTVNEKYFEEIHRRLDAKAEECESLRRSLAEARVEIRKLAESCEAREDDVWRLRTERDAYRTQTQQLEAIREAYSLLVERQPDVPAIERGYSLQLREKERQIERLEERNRALLRRNEAMATAIARQSGRLAMLDEAVRQLGVPCEAPAAKGERELMRDCSDESEPAYCAPVRRSRVTTTTTTKTEQVQVVFNERGRTSRRETSSCSTDGQSP